MNGTNPKEINKAIDLLELEQRGEQRGIQQGLQQGGHDKTFEIAKNLLNADIDLE